MTRHHQPQDPHLAVGVIGIAAAIAPGQRHPDARHLIFGVDHAGGLEIGGEQVAVGVDVGGDVVGDGAGIVADADAAIEGRVAKPDRALLLALVQHLPEPHMMAAIGTVAYRLFEGEVLAPAEIEQRADGRVVIGAIEQHAADDLDGRSQRHGIGGIPAGGLHGAEHVEPVADQPDIDRIAGNALRGPRHHRQVARPRWCSWWVHNAGSAT